MKFGNPDDILDVFLLIFPSLGVLPPSRPSVFALHVQVFTSSADGAGLVALFSS